MSPAMLSSRAGLAAAALLAAAVPVGAHGNLTMDQDKCVLRVGQQVIHFAGYQPQIARTTEFCEDIPSIGKTIVVLDFVDAQLRQVPVEVRVVPAVGDPDEFAREPVLHIPFNKYPTGTISFARDFPEAGDFIGLVTAGEDRSAVARFPFSVGRPAMSIWHYAGLGLAAATIASALLLFGLRRRHRLLTGTAR